MGEVHLSTAFVYLFPEPCWGSDQGAGMGQSAGARELATCFQVPKFSTWVFKNLAGVLVVSKWGKINLFFDLILRRCEVVLWQVWHCLPAEVLAGPKLTL